MCLVGILVKIHVNTRFPGPFGINKSSFNSQNLEKFSQRGAICMLLRIWNLQSKSLHCILIYRKSYFLCILVLLTGYRYLREVDKSLCVSFCLQDPNCTAVTYSVQSPPSGDHNSSLCKFYTSVGEGVYLKMTKPEHNVKS